MAGIVHPSGLHIVFSKVTVHLNYSTFCQIMLFSTFVIEFANGGMKNLFAELKISKLINRKGPEKY